MRTYWRGTGVVLALALLAGCGGAGGSGDGGSDDSMEIKSFTVAPATVEAGQAVTVGWTVDYRTDGVGYWAEFFLTNEYSESEGAPALARVFHVNGEMGPGTAGTTASVTCERRQGASGDVLVCPYSSKLLDTLDLARPVYGVLQACTNSFDSVCDVAALEVSFPLSADLAREADAQTIPAEGYEPPGPAQVGDGAPPEEDQGAGEAP